VITLDTGALLAIERRRDRMLRVLRAAEQTSTPIFVPAVVLAEWWRGRPTARMRLLLDALSVEDVTPTLARAAGEAIAATPGATTIDALVMASAALRGGVVYTSDVGDLLRLVHHFPNVRVLAA
jgi:predicted nucleic acid-binding protein